MYVVYQHLRKTDNEVFYIGIGNNIRPHIKSGRSSFWKNEINKHDYIIKILSDNLEWSEAQQAEIELIKLYGRRDLGLGLLVNLTDGGDGAPGCVPTQEHRDKISKALKGKKKLKPSPMKGKKMKPEHIRYGKDNGMFGKSVPKGKDSPYSKEIIDIVTGQIWYCLQDCSDENNIKKSTLAAWLNGQNKNVSNFRYL